MIDEKAAFYFRHRDQIEEWAALRSVAARALDEALVTSCQDWLSPEGTGGVLQTAADVDDGPWPRVGYTSASWQNAGVELGVVFEWNRGRLLGASRAPYLGVRVPARQPGAKEVRAAVKVAGKEAFKSLGWSHSSDWWPAWGWLDVPADAAALGDYANQCLESLDAAWLLLQPVLEDAVGQATRAPENA